MKNKIFITIIIVLLLIIVGCNTTLGTKEVDMGNTADLVLTISDYFPFKENLIYEYEGIGNEFAEQKIYFEFIEDNKAQLKIINPATNVVKVIEQGDDFIREIYYEGEFYHIENLLNTKGQQDNVLLKEPLVLGNSWTTADGYKRSITALDKEITTPMDSYKALEVTTDFGEARSQKHYYVADIGMVASIYEDDSGRVETLLKSMTNLPLKHNIELYYPSNSDIKTVYTTSTIDFYTNQSIEKLLEDLMKNPPSSDLMPVIPSSAVINSIKLDRTNWSVRVDFSIELLTDMNAGTSLETEILKSIVNTLGRFYDVENVYISVDGKPYESGHYGLVDDEFFRVDVDALEIYR